MTFWRLPAEPKAADGTLERLFYWCHVTSRQPFETGVQRVTRRLHRALERRGVEVIPVGWDDRSRCMEVQGLGPAAFEKRLGASSDRALLFVPEITVDLDPLRLAQVYGLRTAALVHDLIPLKLSAHYESAAVAVYKAYYDGFAQAGRVLTTTRGVADDLSRHLIDNGLASPPIDVVHLPAQLGDHPRSRRVRAPRPASTPLKLVTFGSWEPRKNLPRMLRAVARARQRSAGGITLTLVGRRGLFSAHDAEVRAILAEMADVEVAGSLSDKALADRIEASDVVVYPSWEEGFGLPIGESLWLGRPCLCHNGSAMAEVAPGGGTMMIDMTDETAIADALAVLALQPSCVERLADEAANRPLRSWDDYARDVQEVLERVC